MSSLPIAIASDHAGLTLKTELCSTLKWWGYSVVDLGCTHEDGRVDYPDYAEALARRVSSGEPALGILVCGSGIGMSIVANKIAGVRAALCHEPYSAEMARAHNNANVLCLGARVVGDELAKATVKAFLDGSFEAGRHAARVEKITQLES